MIHINLLLTSFLVFGNMVLFDFTENSNLSNWIVVDDVVMGGQSSGHFEVNQEGHAVFHGSVSLENYGGFSSVRYRFEQKNIDGYSEMLIRLKGDGKKYQFRAKSDKYDRHSYIYEFETSGEWQTIIVPLSKMEPGFRGRKLNMPNYPAIDLEEIAILIGNKKAETFHLEIDKISLE